MGAVAEPAADKLVEAVVDDFPKGGDGLRGAEQSLKVFPHGAGEAGCRLPSGEVKFGMNVP